ncbi:MAG: hypothetical protein HGA52_05315 [Bacteroidales bacterium]|nr:hypothetical protein [Bacteroidales bacterium]
MKKILINKITSILSIILILSVASCSKEKSESGVNGVSSEKIRITGADANTTTKTTLNGLVTSWIQTTDKVGIYSSQSRTATGGMGSSIINTQFTAASSGVSSSFNGTMFWGAASTSHTFYAYYPYATGSPAATAVPVTLPSAQTQSSANSNAHVGALDFMVATPVTVTSPANTNAIANEVNLKYNHLFTVLEFQIKQSSGNGTITKVKLTAPTTNLSLTSGTINITQSTPGEGVAYTIAGGTGSKEITLTITGGVTPTADYATTPKIYMVILPGDFSAENMTIGLEYQNSGFFESTFKTGKAFERGKKYIVQMDVPTVTDGDNNVYGTITIGTQTWMASNLKTTKYNDGTPITYVTDQSTWYASIAGAWCDYENTSSNSTTYGKLYNWYAVDNNEATKAASNGGKNICPVGWHVPTDAEWTTLTDYLGGLSVAGDKLKETGTTHWISNTAATNSSGFTALPGGYRKYDGWGYVSLGTSGRWWSSTPDGTDSAFFRYMSNSGSDVQSSSGIRSFGDSVRCVKD